MIVLRLVWVAAGRLFLFRRDRDRFGDPPPWSQVVVVGWAGLRGVVTLAAVFLIPAGTPYREVLVLAAMIVVAGTLLIQGGTLPALVRRLGLRGPDPRSDALQGATVIESTTRVALLKLDEITGEANDDETVQTVRRANPVPAARDVGEAGRAGSGDTGGGVSPAPADHTAGGARGGAPDPPNRHAEADVIEQVLAMLDIEESMLDLANERSEELSEEPVTTPTAPEGPV